MTQSIFTPQRKAEIIQAADARTKREHSHWIDYAYMALVGAEKDAFQAAFNKIQGSGRRMADLLQDMLLPNTKEKL